MCTLLRSILLAEYIFKYNCTAEVAVGQLHSCVVAEDFVISDDDYLALSIQYNRAYNTKFVKRHVAVASKALANRTVKKHRRRRTNVL